MQPYKEYHKSTVADLTGGAEWHATDVRRSASHFARRQTEGENEANELRSTADGGQDAIKDSETKLVHETGVEEKLENEKAEEQRQEAVRKINVTISVAGKGSDESGVTIMSNNPRC